MKSDKEIAVEAFEWSTDYKPWNEDLPYRDYARHGFEVGYKQAQGECVMGRVWVLTRTYGHLGHVEKVWGHSPTWDEVRAYIIECDGLNDSDETEHLDNQRHLYEQFQAVEVYDVHWGTEVQEVSP